MNIKQLVPLKIILLSLAMAVNYKATAQTTSADSLQQSQTYYNLGVQYKDGSGVPMNYTTAFNYFQQSAQLGNAQSVYALAYMQYKGLGCTQDYKMAATLFAQGAALGKDNSMYFYSLCLRNGYGIAKNEDSARYWLSKADSLGYKQATQELRMIAGENSNDSAKALLQQLRNAAVPVSATINQYTKIVHHLPAAEIIAGDYTGYIIQYDWSGQNAVSSKKLSLSLSEAKGSHLSGKWMEDSTTAVDFDASLATDSLVFNKTKYKRKDHYSPDSSIAYNFQDAKLNLVQAGDSIFLAGNITMFSPQRKEPSKPLLVVLSRNSPVDTIETIAVKAYPNPFSNSFNLQFSLPSAANVQVQLLTISGTVLYSNAAGKLTEGDYLLPVQPGNLASGIYVVKLIYGNKSVVIKVMKE